MTNNDQLPFTENPNKTLLAPQVFSLEEEVDAMKANMTLDFRSNPNIVLTFAERFDHCKPGLKKHLRWLESLSEDDLSQAVIEAVKNRILITMLMLTGKCNANCGICYTDCNASANELKWKEIMEIMDQVKKMGCKTIYIAGEGEPTLDDSFLKVLVYAEKLDMEVLVFTNGLLLSRDDICEEQWGITSEEFVNKLADLPVHFYHKLWTTDPKETRKLMGLTPENDYEYGKYELNNGRTINIPRGLDLLLKKFPRERVGIQTVIEKRTYNYIIQDILPLINEANLKSYVEPLLHSGANIGSDNFNPTAEQIESLAHLMVRRNCSRVAYMLAISNEGFITPAQSMKPNDLRVLGYNLNDLNIRDGEGGIKNIGELMGAFAGTRFEIRGCLCEILAKKVASIEGEPYEK